jgi:hypothetical protein
MLISTDGRLSETLTQSSLNGQQQPHEAVANSDQSTDSAAIHSSPSALGQVGRFNGSGCCPCRHTSFV